MGKKRTITMFIFLIFYLVSGCSAPEKLIFSGIIEGRELPVIAQTSGLLVALNLDEGEMVTPDQPLAKLDDQLLQWQLAEVEAAKESVFAQWEEAQAGSRGQQVKQVAATLDQYDALGVQATARVKQASAALEQMEANLSQIEKQLAGAEQTLAFQEKQWQKVEQLFRAGATSEKEYEGQKEAVNQAETKVNQLKAQYQAMLAQLEGTKQELEVTEAQPLVIQAQKQAVEAQLSLLEEGSTTYTLKSLAALHKQAEAKVELVKEQLKKTTIFSPIEGLILRKHVELGELVKPGTILFTVMDPRSLEVTVYVPEADLQLVYIGKEVSVQVDAYPEQTFRGQIVRISNKAEFTPRQVQTPKERTKMVFAVKVQLTEGWEELKAGMPADVFLALEEGGDK